LPLEYNKFLMAAYLYAGFCSRSSMDKSLVATCPPFMTSSISIPAAAIGSNPTGVNTEYLPPISSGTTKVSYPS